MSNARPSPLALSILLLSGCEAVLPAPDLGVGADLGLVGRDADSFPDAEVARDRVEPDAGTRDAEDPLEDASTSEPTDLGGRDLGVLDLGAPDLGFGDLGLPDLGVDAGDPCAEPYPSVSAPPAPPYAGTLFIDPNIITESDPTSFVGLVYAGQANRTMYDRRTASFNVVNAYLFNASFGSTVTVEIQVNPEFGRDEAEVQAVRYAEAIGRLPGFLFRDLRTVWIHRGLQPFGGGNDNLLIHTEQGEQYAQAGLLEETFLHEAAHTSMDAHHGAAPRWLEAQAADGTFLSTYARDNPGREDVAETLGPYLAARFRAQRLSPALRTTILGTVPSRIAYLDCLGLSMDLVP